MTDHESEVDSPESSELRSWARDSVERMGQNVEFFLRLYVVLGLLTAAGGAGYFALSFLNVDLTEPQQIALIMSATGLVVSLASWGMLTVWRQRQESSVRRIRRQKSLEDFILGWIRFEQAGKRVLASEQREFNPHSIRDVIALLREMANIDASDVLAVENAMQARNLVLHHDEQLPEEVLQQYTATLAMVTSKLASAFPEGDDVETVSPTSR